MPRVSFTTNEGFGPIPIAKYPARLSVRDIMLDSQGNPMLDANNQPAKLKTNAGDEMWNIEAVILDGPQIGRKVFDNFSFGEKAVKRPNIAFTRMGAVSADNPNATVEAEELDGTCWWIDVDRHEPAMKDGQARVDKQGKPLMNARIGFAGYEPMSPQDAKKYLESFAKYQQQKAANSAPANGAYSETEEGDRPPF